jgi:hypothetical protein
VILDKATVRGERFFFLGKESGVSPHAAILAAPEAYENLGLPLRIGWSSDRIF